MPQPGDAVFVTATDPNRKTVFYNMSTPTTPTFQSILMEESGTGSISLYMAPSTTPLVANTMTVSLYGPAIWDFEFGSAQLARPR